MSDPAAPEGPSPLARWGSLAVAFALVVFLLVRLTLDAVDNAITFIGSRDEGGGEPSVVEGPAGPGTAEQAEPADPAAEAAPARVYVIEPGDTGSSIAEETLGDAARWPEIAEANGLNPEGGLEVGAELRIP